ncbi:MAG TPA: L,D-transpeptidase [Polyangiaceae bacterium]
MDVERDVQSGVPRVLRALLAGLAFVPLLGCSHASASGQAAADGGAPAAMMAMPESDASPFSVKGAAQPVDVERFPSKLAALAWETRVMEQPSAGSKMLGYVRAGGVVAAAAAGVKGDGCKGEWRGVAPIGFVCVEAGNATLDLEATMVKALATRPDTTARLPYMYGIVRRPGPIYARLPTRAEAEAAEPGLDARMKAWLVEGGEDGAGFRADYWLRGKTAAAPSPGLAPALLPTAASFPSPADLWASQASREVPDWLSGSKFPPGNLSTLRHGDDLVVGETKHHNGFALSGTAVVDGRRYGITTDLLVFPIDRMRPIEGSAFHGYRVPEDVQFPFALVRRDGAAAYTMHGGKMVKAKDVPRRAAIPLTGKQRFVDGVLHFQTTDGLWLSDRYASRVDGVKKMPKWANDGERWIDVSIGKQVLMAYDGTKPAYVTLVSTGEAGLEDPETSKATARGIFRIHTKHLTTTMASKVVGEEFELKDIPYVQYFEDGYALHAAYWHDDFGTPRSHGCINLAPEDARWLFEWTEPQLPEGWHGVRKALRGSVVFIHP